MNAEIIAIGSEILLGQILNTNARFLSEKLAALGIDVYYHTTVGDNAKRLLETFKTASARSDLVITTGGLGPTGDDLTKETLAEFLGLHLEISPVELEKVKQYFTGRGIPWVESNAKQSAFLPGSSILHNQLGTAPGMAYKNDDCAYIVLPGPPREMQTMFSDQAVPWIRDNLGGAGVIPIYSHVLKFIGISESKLEDTFHDLFDHQTAPTLATLATQGEIHLRLTARTPDQESFKTLIAPVLDEIRTRAGKYIFAEGPVLLTEAIAGMLLQNNLTVSTAESCTGGLLSARFTEVPGSSAYFLGSIVAYSNDVKIKVLGVPAELIAAHGAVSAEVAAAMASGVRKLTDSSIGIGITGIAGPGGGTAEKPVGLVYIALDTIDYHRVVSPVFPHDRENIRERSVKTAQQILFRYLRGPR